MKLTDFEIMVLRAVVTTSPDAYGISIIDYITNNTGSEPAFSRVYSTLEKLETQLMSISMSNCSPKIRWNRRRRTLRRS